MTTGSEPHDNGGRESPADHGDLPAEIVASSSGRGRGSTRRQAQSARARVEELLGAALNAGPVGRVVLEHLAQGAAQVVNHWDPSSLEGKDPATLADEVMDAASEDASYSTAPSRYCIAVYRSDGSSYGRKIFLLPGGASDPSSPSYVDPEPANGYGLLAQSMRHAEFAMHGSMVSQHEQIADLRQENSELKREIARRDVDRIRLYQREEELISQLHKRALELRAIERREKREDLVEATIIHRVLPAIAWYRPELTHVLGIQPISPEEFVKGARAGLATTASNGTAAAGAQAKGEVPAVLRVLTERIEAIADRPLRDLLVGLLYAVVKVGAVLEPADVVRVSAGLSAAQQTAVRECWAACQSLLAKPLAPAVAEPPDKKLLEDLEKLGEPKPQK